MVDVAMRNENRIEKVDACPKSLLSKVGRCINKNLAALMFDQNGNAKSFVSRVLRTTRLTVAPDGRYAG